jgi:CheY-like chemotaxis protein
MKTAVVIDDSPDMGPQLAGILRRLGIDVVAVCENGLQGLAALRRFRPTIATVDNNMPGLDGLAVVARAVAENIPTKLVLCTGASNKNGKTLAAEAGVTAFIGKPFDQVLIARELALILDEG